MNKALPTVFSDPESLRRRCCCCRRVIDRPDALLCPFCGCFDLEHLLPTEPAGTIRITMQPGETSGKYSRPPFNQPEPRRCDRCGRAWMAFWIAVVWLAALTATIIWGPNP